MDATGLFKVEHPNLLVAKSGRTLEMVQKIPDGSLVNGQVHTSRNPRFNALAHAVFHKLAEAQGVSIDTFKLYLKAATGRVDLVRLPNGRLAVHGRPMNFGAMSEEEFRAFWDEALVFIFSEIMPGVPHHVEQEIHHMLFSNATAGRY